MPPPRAAPATTIGAGERHQQAGTDQRPGRTETRMHPLCQHPLAEEDEARGRQGMGQHEGGVAGCRVIGGRHGSRCTGAAMKGHPGAAQLITPATRARGEGAPEGGGQQRQARQDVGGVVQAAPGAIVGISMCRGDEQDGAPGDQSGHGRRGQGNEQRQRAAAAQRLAHGADSAVGKGRGVTPTSVGVGRNPGNRPEEGLGACRLRACRLRTCGRSAGARRRRVRPPWRRGGRSA